MKREVPVPPKLNKTTRPGASNPSGPATPPPLNRDHETTVLWSVVGLSILLALLLALLIFWSLGTPQGETSASGATGTSQPSESATSSSEQGRSADKNSSDSEAGNEVKTPPSESQPSPDDPGDSAATNSNAQSTTGQDAPVSQPSPSEEDQQEENSSPSAASDALGDASREAPQQNKARSAADLIDSTRQPNRSKPSAGKIGSFSQAGASFFGLHHPAEKVAFVIDVSSSMNRNFSNQHSNLMRAFEEVENAVDRLTKDQFFTVALYDTSAYTNKDLTMASPTKQSKEKLDQWLNRVIATGGTNPIPAMEIVLQKKYDVVFLVSDGEFDWTAVEAITKANKHNVTICCISLQANSITLKEIANKNRGQYITVSN